MKIILLNYYGNETMFIVLYVLLKNNLQFI